MTQKLADHIEQELCSQGSGWEHDGVLMCDWDVSDVTTMKNLFSNLQNFNEDISSWNTSRVTDCREMFEVHSTHACPSCALTTAGRPPPIG